MKLLLKKLVLTLLVVTTLTGCGPKSKELRYDPLLLEQEVVNQDLHIAYSVPAGFKLVRQSFTDSIAELELKANPFTERRLAIYVDTLIGNSSISLYDMRQIPYEKTEDRLDFYFSTYNPNGQWESIEKENFKHGDFGKIVALDMENKSADRRLIKLYFYENDKAQFSIDYFTRDSYYADLKPFIESSIASVHKNYEIVIDLLDQ